ncbi:alcohol dehydrogenase catalytic domain-containing protein [Candidatus Woesearchaeota archaeon]|nr:alcohol dehydrogenase catalytic domain-containing protein [Candidatus Woesearchaeota archaeon]
MEKGPLAMKIRAIGVRKGKKEPEIFLIEKPQVTKPNQACIKMLDAGICGTDIDIIENSLVDSPPGEDKLILGHEAIGKIVETGEQTRFRKGDHVALIPRHGCGICAPCKSRRSDFCETGQYTAAGQHKLHGYFSEFFVEEDEYIVKVPEGIVNVAVLAEPFSIVEKALQQVMNAQKRIPTHEFRKTKAVVFGMGSVGMSAIALLRNQGIETHVLGRRDNTDAKARLATEFGAKYVDIRNKNVNILKEEIGKVDLVIEATGATQMVIDLIELMKRNAIYVFLGIPKGSEELCFNIKGMVHKIVRENLIIMGSVNSQKEHFEVALKHIEEIHAKKPDAIEKIITNIYHLDEYKLAFSKSREETIKKIIRFKED